MPFKSPRHNAIGWRQRMDGMFGQVSAPTYADKVLGYGPIAYWPLWETSGVIAHCLINSAQNGTYTGAHLANALGPDGVNYAPYFDADTDHVDVYSLTFANAFGYDEGSAMIWTKVLDASVWTDGVTRYSLRWETNGTNRLRLLIGAANNQCKLNRQSGGVNQVIDEATSDTAWQCWIITWSLSNNRTRLYKNGVETVASPAIGLGAWVGLLSAASTYVGSYSPGSSEWLGWLAHVAAWNSVLDAPTIAILATPTP